MKLLSVFSPTPKSYIGKRMSSIVFVAMLSCVLDYSVSLINAFFGGLYLGEEALIVSGVSSPVYELVLFFCEVIPAGGMYLQLIYESEGKKEKSEKCVRTAFTSMIVIGLAVSLFTYFGRYWIADFYSLEEETALMEAEYLTYFAPVPFLTAVEYCVFEIIFRDDDNRMTLFMLVIPFVVSLPISELLVKYMGIKGLALGSVAGDLLSLLTGVIILIAKGEKYKFKPAFDWACFKESFSMGFMYGQGNIYYIVYSVVMYWFIGKFFGESCMAVFALLDSVTDICEAFTGVPYAMENHLGVYIGEKNKGGVKKLLTSALRIQFIVALVATVLTVVFAEPVAEFFEFEEEYAEECIFALRIYALSFVSYALLTFLNEYYTSIELYMPSFILSAGQYLLAGIVVAVPLGLIFGSTGIYIAKFIECPLAILITYLYIRKKTPYKTLLPINIDDCDVISRDFERTDRGIAAMSEWVQAELISRDIAQEKKESLLAGVEAVKNSVVKKKRQLFECTLSFADEPQLVVRGEQ